MSESEDRGVAASFEEALEWARRDVKRNPDQTQDEKVVLDEALKYAPSVDADEVRRARLKRELDRQTRPGTTAPLGQLSLPGLGEYAYEPERLIRDNDGHIIEQQAALPRHKAAESERARRNAEVVQQHANRKTMEWQQHATWAIEELAAGRPSSEVTFDTFVRETNLWTEGEAPPEPDPMADEERDAS